MITEKSPLANFCKSEISHTYPNTRGNPNVFILRRKRTKKKNPKNPRDKKGDKNHTKSLKLHNLCFTPLHGVNPRAKTV